MAEKKASQPSTTYQTASYCGFPTGYTCGCEARKPVGVPFARAAADYAKLRGLPVPEWVLRGEPRAPRAAQPEVGLAAGAAVVAGAIAPLPGAGMAEAAPGPITAA
jgi:hypothetical protein